MRRFGLRTHHSCAIPGPNAAGGCSIAVAVAFGLKLTTCHCCSDFGRWYSWRVESGTGRAFGLKQSSYQLEGWQHLLLEGLKVFIAPGRIWRWTWWTCRCSLEEGPPYRKFESHVWSQIFSQSWSIYKMAIGACYAHNYSLFVLAKWRKHSKVQDPLTFRQSVLLPMQRWRRPVLKMFAISAIDL